MCAGEEEEEERRGSGEQQRVTPAGWGGTVAGVREPGGVASDTSSCRAWLNHCHMYSVPYTYLHSLDV